MAWAWIPITIGAALSQTLRNAAQRHLVTDLGTLGATLVRFLYGLPFAVLWLAVVWGVLAPPAVAPLEGGWTFVAWTAFGAVAQIVATACLLRAMAERNFVLGIAYSKTEVIQAALFGLVILGDRMTWLTVGATLCATAGVLLVSLPAGGRSIRLLLSGWTAPAALSGLASGAAFALSAVGYRGAALDIAAAGPAASAAVILVVAQAIQTILLGGWLLARNPGVVLAVLRAWRLSLAAGFLGALASALWFTAFALESLAHVRTLGMIELIFGFVLSARLFRERFSTAEQIGLLLLSLGLLAAVLPT